VTAPHWIPCAPAFGLTSVTDERQAAILADRERIAAAKP